MKTPKANTPSLVDHVKQLKRKYLGYGGSIAPFEHKGPRPADYGEPGEFEKIFWDELDRPIVKWHHYFSIYDRHLSRFMDSEVRFLEIGVSKGGSLDVWRRFFGEKAVIFGIDIDPACASFDGISGQVRIGSQADPDFLSAVVSEMGGVDVVLDDGSHDSNHIRTSFRTLFPKMSEGGVYMIEDLHAAYWSDFSGGYRRKSSFIEDIKVMIDDMHHWYHYHDVEVKDVNEILTGIHMYDSLAVFDRGRVSRPAFSSSGGRFEQKS
jgi:23S rRNA U2552 (ribose-2'-O)-methylase RlmE/FtsJ